MRTLTEEEAAQTLRFMEKLVVCLDQIGSSYASSKDRAWALSHVFNANVFREAAQVRHILSSKYSYEVEEGEQLSEVEKVAAGTVYYKLPNTKQLAKYKLNK